MLIRKKFKFESAHIVRDCSSERCKKSIHGHSYIVEVFLESDQLDNGNMVVDFGLLGRLREFVDMFDHSYIMWDKESDEFKNFIYKHSYRNITLPLSPSAEGFALIFHYYMDRIISKTVWKNGEKSPVVEAVRVHETSTGYAEADWGDIEKLTDVLRFGKGIIISKGIVEELKNKNFLKEIHDDNTVYDDNVEFDLKYK